MDDVDHGGFLGENSCAELHEKTKDHREAHPQNNAQLQGERYHHQSLLLSEKLKTVHDVLEKRKEWQESAVTNLQHARGRGNHLLFIVLGERACKHCLQEIIHNTVRPVKYTCLNSEAKTTAP